jgi:hypothetical protein
MQKESTEKTDKAMEGKNKRKCLQMSTLKNQTHESGETMKVRKLQADGEKVADTMGGGYKCST